MMHMEVGAVPYELSIIKDQLLSLAFHSVDRELLDQTFGS